MPQQHPLYFDMIVLMLLMMMKSVKTHITDGSFNVVEPGKSIMGRVGSERPAKTSIQCSSMCLLEDSCLGYQYKDNRTQLGACILIYSGCQNVQSNSSAVTYKKVCSQPDEAKPSNGSWIPPPCWTGPSPILYQSFDSSDGFVLKEGTQNPSVPVPLVSGKVNNAWTLDHTKSQWVDLGIHNEACVTQPENCGAADGAISVWLNSVGCSNWAGFISSWAYGSSGSVISCTFENIRFEVYPPEGRFIRAVLRPIGWIHIVLNYLGPNEGEGIRGYFDGTEVAVDITKYPYSYSTGPGRIVVGKLYTNRNEKYASVQIDNLIYFNKTLTRQEIETLHRAA